VIESVYPRNPIPATNVRCLVRTVRDCPASLLFLA
jgi:hypothetical protein